MMSRIGKDAEDACDHDLPADRCTSSTASGVTKHNATTSTKNTNDTHRKVSTVLDWSGEGTGLIREPDKNDVLSGRGKTAFIHPGNKLFRQDLLLALDEFKDTVSRKKKTRIIELLMQKVTERGGRFLKKAGSPVPGQRPPVYAGPYVVASYQEARLKTKNALRDAAAKKVKWIFGKDHAEDKTQESNPSPLESRTRTCVARKKKSTLHPKTTTLLGDDHAQTLLRSTLKSTPLKDTKSALYPKTTTPDDHAQSLPRRNLKRASVKKKSRKLHPRTTPGDHAQTLWRSSLKSTPLKSTDALHHNTIPRVLANLPLKIDHVAIVADSLEEHQINVQSHTTSSAEIDSLDDWVMALYDGDDCSIDSACLDVFNEVPMFKLPDVSDEQSMYDHLLLSSKPAK